MMPRRFWTPHEIEVLRQRYAGEPTAAIARDLGRAAGCLHNKARELGLRKAREVKALMTRQAVARLDHGGKQTLFQPGQAAWNKGLKGATGLHPNTAANHFKPGNVTGIAAEKLMPVGSLRVTTRDQTLQRKVNNTPGKNNLRWLPVHRLVWQEAHGPIPPGHFVVFKPGRRTTELSLITPDALELVTRAEQMRRNSVHARYPPELARLLQLRGVLARTIKRKSEEVTRHEQH